MSLATHNNFSRMPDPNNYVRDQSVNHILIIQADRPNTVNVTTNSNDQLRTLNATMANPATSYKSDRTHLTPMSFDVVAKSIYSSLIITTVIYHTYSPRRDIDVNMNSRPTTTQYGK